MVLCGGGHNYMKLYMTVQIYNYDDISAFTHSDIFSQKLV